MDSSRVFGGKGGGSNSESGWTKYIASTFHETNNNYDDEGEEDWRTSGEKQGLEAYQYVDDGDERSDDSMTSDASSGPSHHGPLHQRRNCGKGDLKHAKVKEQSRSSSGKKQYKQVEARLYSSNMRVNADEKEKPGHKASTAFSYANSSSRTKGSRTTK